jgi:hypothetical protein
MSIYCYFITRVPNFILNVSGLYKEDRNLFPF